VKNGDAEWVLLHIEAQGHGGGNLRGCYKEKQKGFRDFS
jgi:hypothetical protein